MHGHGLMIERTRKNEILHLVVKGVILGLKNGLTARLRKYQPTEN
jgi:hypothetical protein